MMASQRRTAGSICVMSIALAAACVQTPSAERAELVPDASIDCGDLCTRWNEPVDPFHIYGDTYYVGVGGLSAILIASEGGHVLLDGALPQSAPLIAANIEALGFRLEDVRLIVNSHVHPDHSGGIPALARASGARVAASPPSAAALAQGALMPDDPQFAGDALLRTFPAAPEVAAIADLETLRVGPLAVTAHFTPGHTPGGTTWTWRSCEDGRCLDMVYADSLNSVAADGFRFTGDAEHPSRVGEFRASIARVAALPCDVLLAPHPSFVRMMEKRDALQAGADPNPFIDPDHCRSYAAVASDALDRRIAMEEAG